MRAISRSLLLTLPALALALAACVTTAPPPPVVLAPQPQRTVIVTPPPQTQVYSGSSAAPLAGAMRLSSADVQSLLANNTAVGVSAAGTPYHVYFAGNGTARFRNQDMSDRGTWRVLPDGSLCSTLPSATQGVEHCYSVVRYGNVILYEQSNGVAEGSIRVVSGDPLGL